MICFSSAWKSKAWIALEALVEVAEHVGRCVLGQLAVEEHLAALERLVAIGHGAQVRVRVRRPSAGAAKPWASA